MRKAFSFGINNYPTAPLNGCVNDTNDIANFIVSKCGFTPDEVRLLVNERATTDAILERLNWLINVEPGSELFFHHSCHGTQYAGRGSNQEIDGLLEVVCPWDFDWTERHMITDKQLFSIFSRIPAGCKFIG